VTVFSNEIATAHQLIAENGQAATWQKQTEVVNVGQPWKTTAGAPQTFPVVVVRLPVKAQPTQILSPGTSVATNVEKLLMAGDVPFTPELNDRIVIAGDTKQVKDIDVLQPDGTPILYTLTVK
jgi:hypothetical protein